jgi:hypothetical protein
MPPSLADLIHARGCKLKCEKFLTLPEGNQFAGFLPVVYGRCDD